jgi:tetratricopeptide (TPR) repeat protein
MLAVALMLHASPVCAEEETASVHEEEGARLYIAKSYEGAIKQFSLAYRLDPKPRYLFNIAQAYRSMGLAAEATEYYQRYINDEQKIDPTIYADIVSYMERYYAAQEGKDRPHNSPDAPEPAPQLAAEEVIDAEELIAQYVRDYRAGNNAAANELIEQLKMVYEKRHDALLLYYIASGYDQVKRNTNALDYYKRYLATDPGDATLRTRAVKRVESLTPPPPGQKYLWASLGLGIGGLAGVFTGVGLFVQSQDIFNQFLNATAETDKLALRDRGQPPLIGSAIAYSIGGALLGGALIFSIVAIKKGVRQQPAVRSSKPRLDAGASAFYATPSGFTLTLGGRF